MLFPGFRIDQNRDWTIIDEGYLHVGSKLAGLNFLPKIRCQLRDEFFVKGHGNFRSSCPRIGGPVSFFCAGEQGNWLTTSNSPLLS